MSFTRCAAVLLIGTVLLWSPTLGFGMLYEDRRDAQLTLDAERLEQQMRTQPTRVVTIASRYLEVQLCGVSASCFHTGNVFWHTLNTVLLLAVAWLWLPPWGAVAAAVIFAAHPIQTEAVSYVSARSDVLSTTGLLLALLSASLGSLTGAVVGVVFAALAKETAIVAWGLVFLWAAWTRASGFTWKWAILTGIGGALTALVIWFKIRDSGVVLDSVLAGQQMATIWRLLVLLPIPVGFTIDHDWQALAPYGPVALIVAACVTALALTEGWQRRSWWALGWLWTLVALSPRLVVPLFEGLHERHMTIPLVGWALCAGAWLSKTSAQRISIHG